MSLWLNRPARPAAAAAASGEARGRRLERAALGQLGHECAPAGHGLLRPAMDLEPRERVRKGTAYEQRPRRTRGDVGIAQPALKRDDLVQAFDICLLYTSDAADDLLC